MLWKKQKMSGDIVLSRSDFGNNDYGFRNFNKLLTKFKIPEHDYKIDKIILKIKHVYYPLPTKIKTKKPIQKIKATHFESCSPCGKYQRCIITEDLTVRYIEWGCGCWQSWNLRTGSIFDKHTCITKHAWKRVEDKT
jgi:hypothetical protein